MMGVETPAEIHLAMSSLSTSRGYTLISRRTSLQHGKRRAASVHYYDKLQRAKIHLLRSTYFIDIFMKNMQHCIVVSAILRSSTFHYREKLCLYKEKLPGYITRNAQRNNAR